ncbi:MAG: IS630 family transposase [Proteobacteria bacterium]|nr:IS630 family transposase [Pseudomonadota bacterium]
MFIDESGMLMLPTVRRTWAPRGQTPILHHRGRRHQKVSVIGGLTISPRKKQLRLFLHWHPDANVGEVEVIDFLRELLRHLRGRVIIVWDRLNAHRSRRVKAYPASRTRVTLELLPPYAPELNPVEGVWSNLKYHRMPNHGIHDLAELHDRAEQEAHIIASCPDLLRGFVSGTPLPIRLPSIVHYNYRDQ